MAAGAGAVVVVVNGDITGLEKALKRALKTSETTGKRMTKSMDGVNQAMQRLQRAVMALAGAWAVRELVRVSDAYTLLDAKLKLVTNSTEEAAATWQKLFDVAQETRSSFRDTANTFINLQLNVKDVGVTIDQTLEFLELWNKALIINGSTQREAASATLQVKQAMSSGRLAGEEYRGVSEGNAYWMTELAKATGYTVGEIRELSMEQKLSRDFILDATPKMRESINKNFAGITKTVGQAFTQLQNVVESVWADSNKASEGTKNVAIAIGDLAQTIENNREEINDLFTGIVTQAAWLVETLPDVADKAVGVYEALPGWLWETGLIAGLLLGKGKLAFSALAAAGLFLDHAKEVETELRSIARATEEIAAAEEKLAKINPGSIEASGLRAAIERSKERIALREDEIRLAENLAVANRLETEMADAYAKAKLKATKEELLAGLELDDQKADRIERDRKFTSIRANFLKSQKKETELTKEQEKALKEEQKARNEVSAALLEQDEYLKLEATQVEANAQHYDELRDSLERANEERKAAEELLTNQKIDAALLEDFEAIDRATEEWAENQARLVAASEQLWEDFVSNTGNIIESFISDTLKGEFDSVEDMFRGLLDSMLDMLISFIAKAAANSLISAIFGGGALGPGSFTLGTLFGGLGGGGGGAVTGAAGGGIGAWIASKFGGGAAATAGTTSGAGYVLGTGSGAFGTYGATGSVPVTLVATKVATPIAPATLPGATSSGGLSGLGGLGLGAAAYAAFAGPNLLKTLSGADPQLEDFLNEKLVQPFQIAAQGVTDEFQSVSETMAAQLVPELAKFDAISIDAANGVLVMGQNIRGAAGAADNLNSIMGNEIQLYDQASGTWRSAGISMSELVAEVDAMGPSSAEAVTELSELIASQHGLASISDELEASYYALGNATRELAGVTTVAARAFRDAGGSISSINWQSIPSDQQHDTLKAMQKAQSYAHGTDWVPMDGPAYLHAGEAVLTKEENAARMTEQRESIEVNVFLDGKALDAKIDAHVVGRERRGAGKRRVSY